MNTSQLVAIGFIVFLAFMTGFIVAVAISPDPVIKTVELPCNCTGHITQMQTELNNIKSVVVENGK